MRYSIHQGKDAARLLKKSQQFRALSQRRNAEAFLPTFCHGRPSAFPSAVCKATTEGSWKTPEQEVAQ